MFNWRSYNLLPQSNETHCPAACSTGMVTLVEMQSLLSFILKATVP